MKRIPYIIIISTLFLLISCDDIFETDISKKSVVLLAPHDSLITTVSAQTFWWDYIEDAANYQLQLVSPNFDKIENLLFDTTISLNKFYFNLSPGKYQWRVRASNIAYSTLFTTYTLTIDSSIDLSNNILILISPNDYDTTNSLSITFSWEGLYNADFYNLQLLYSNSVILDSSLSVNGMSFELNGDRQGTYTWKVNAYNSYSETEYSFRQFYIDTIRPVIRTLDSPLDNDILQDTLVNFYWSRPQSSGSSEFDSLYLYSDELLESMVSFHY